MLLVVGRVIRPHGLRGEVQVEVRTDDPGRRFAAGSVLATQPELGPLTVAGARPHAGGLIVAFTGVEDRDAAERLRGGLLVIDSADVPPPEDPDVFHDAQLIGLDVRTVDGRHVGTVTDVRHHGQDLLVIRRDEPAKVQPMDTERLPLGDAPAQAVKDQDTERLPLPGTPAQAVTDLPRDAADEVLVPFVAALVPEVDPGAGWLVIDPPPGLLDEGEAV